MKRRYLIIIEVAILVAIFSITAYSYGRDRDTYVLTVDAEPLTTMVQEEFETEINTIEPTTEPVVEQPVIEEVITEPNFHTYMSCDWDYEDSYLLCKIAMAEAEGEDVEGKAYVMMVVLNRMMSDEFPDTISDVIFQKIPSSKHYQFSPIENGRFDRVEPNDECWQALDMIMVDKWDKSQGALYFESEANADNWHSRNLEYLFTHGGHRFYR